MANILRKIIENDKGEIKKLEKLPRKLRAMQMQWQPFQMKNLRQNR